MKVNKLKTLLGAILITIALCGCDANEYKVTTSDDPDSIFITISYEHCGRIVYDSRTGVQYWFSTGSYNYGSLTMLVDSDGKPLIYEGG